MALLIFERMLFSVAGHTQHEMTSATAFKSVFKYLEEMRVKTPERKPEAKKRRISDREDEKDELLVKKEADHSKQQKSKVEDEVEPNSESSENPKEENGAEKAEPEKIDNPDENAKEENGTETVEPEKVDNPEESNKKDESPTVELPEISEGIAKKIEL